MKEQQKIRLIKLVSRYISFKDGFWVYKNERLVNEECVREFIREQGLEILEKDITEVLSELTYNKSYIDVDEYFYNETLNQKGNDKSKYFENMDKLYPNNKFREIMNYYLFSEDCYSFILVGYGQTGKTTFVSLIAKIIGEEFFGRSNVNLLRNSHGTAILEGKKLFEVAEAQDLDLDTANSLKSIVTNDEIYINPKFQLPRTIKPHNKMIMTCNNIPRFKVTDDGIIRRFIIINMNNKIVKQDKHFLEEIEEDIPNIIKEAYEHPFNIEDFAKEQYEIFENDPQWGYGYGDENINYANLDNEYESYRKSCQIYGYKPRNKANFDKFLELEKIYKSRIKKCDTTLNGSTELSGMKQLNVLGDADLPF